MLRVGCWFSVVDVLYVCVGGWLFVGCSLLLFRCLVGVVVSCRLSVVDGCCRLVNVVVWGLFVGCRLSIDGELLFYVVRFSLFCYSRSLLFDTNCSWLDVCCELLCVVSCL